MICRVFALIENSAQEHVHGNQDNLNPEQLIVEKALASCFTSVLQQCSAPIFMVCWSLLPPLLKSMLITSPVKVYMLITSPVKVYIFIWLPPLLKSMFITRIISLLCTIAHMCLTKYTYWFNTITVVQFKNGPFFSIHNDGNKCTRDLIHTRTNLYLYVILW